MEIANIIAVAVLVEALVEYGKNIANSENHKILATQIITIVISVLLAFAFDKDIFNAIGLTVNHIIGVILTGIVISRGSNYASDLIGKIGAKKA